MSKTPDHVEHYWEHGYTIVDDLLDASQIAFVTGNAAHQTAARPPQRMQSVAWPITALVSTCARCCAMALQDSCTP